jgi:GPH family glycoside/pentoside/hexuronide:cation symporter
LLEYFGYSATATTSTAAARGILLMVSVVPAVFLLVGLAALLFYRLDDRMLEEIEQSLTARREALDADPSGPDS